jgi:hypothetical protein
VLAERIGDSFTVWHWPNWTWNLFYSRRVRENANLFNKRPRVGRCELLLLLFWCGGARRVTNEKATASHLVYWVWKVSSECESERASKRERALCISCIAECVEGEWWMGCWFIFKLCPIHLYETLWVAFINAEIKNKNVNVSGSGRWNFCRHFFQTK